MKLYCFPFIFLAFGVLFGAIIVSSSNPRHYSQGREVPMAKDLAYSKFMVECVSSDKTEKQCIEIMQAKK